MSADRVDAELKRLRTRLKQRRQSQAGAEEAGKWTAAEGFASAVDKLEDRIIVLEAEAADRSEADDLKRDPRQLVRAIQVLALDLPGYLLDDLIAALEEARRCADPEDWAPEA